MKSWMEKGENVGSPWAMTDIFRIFAGLSMSARIWEPSAILPMIATTKSRPFTYLFDGEAVRVIILAIVHVMLTAR